MEKGLEVCWIYKWLVESSFVGHPFSPTRSDLHHSQNLFFGCFLCLYPLLSSKDLINHLMRSSMMFTLNIPMFYAIFYAFNLTHSIFLLHMIWFLTHSIYQSKPQSTVLGSFSKDDLYNESTGWISSSIQVWACWRIFGVKLDMRIPGSCNIGWIRFDLWHLAWHIIGDKA